MKKQIKEIQSFEVLMFSANPLSKEQTKAIKGGTGIGESDIIDG